MIFKEEQDKFLKFMRNKNIPQSQLNHDAQNTCERIKDSITDLIAIGAVTNPESAVISAILTGFYFRDWLENEKKKENQDQKEIDILDVLWNRS